MERLLDVCEMHFAANRLTTGVGGTAVQCYREVQSLDPANRKALEGLQRVFGKYAAWARAALEKENVAKARGHVEKLKGLNPEAPEVAELEGAIARLEKQAARSPGKGRGGCKRLRDTGGAGTKGTRDGPRPERKERDEMPNENGAERERRERAEIEQREPALNWWCVSWGGQYSDSQQKAYHAALHGGEPGHQDHQ